MNVLQGLKRERYRLCSFILNRPNSNSRIINQFYVNSSEKRHFSLQSTIDSISRTQTGIFKTLSESTPVEYCQKFLLHIHDTTGLPWWATIICTTIMMRGCVTVPLAIYQNYIMAKLEFVKLEMDSIAKELTKETSIAVKMYNWDEKTARITFKRSVIFCVF